ncbi:hypothetical protein TCARB_1438 [Thermofilum adornatum 1505]|uniref:Uncharacterized protein n=1 Tax=Thermofilum adornatum 1505 TaxID=697581 RepID=A0A3G1A9N9_9CREN|nr:hypothetical protein TCARB_1438 [Thermofilum adornatum 1505]
MFKKVKYKKHICLSMFYTKESLQLTCYITLVYRKVKEHGQLAKQV